MNINDIYVLIQYIINKNQQGYLNPAQFNNVINQAQRSYLSYLLGSFQSYLPGRPVSRVELGQNSVVRQRLSPVIKSTTLGIDMYGVSSYPEDYLQTDAIRMVDTYQRVRFVQQDSLYSYYNSIIDPVQVNPIYLIENTGFQFYPLNLQSATLSYVSNPPDMSWGYHLSSNGRPVYCDYRDIYIGAIFEVDGWSNPSSQNYQHSTGYTYSLIFLEPVALIGNYYEIDVTISNNGTLSEGVSISFGGLSLPNAGTNSSSENYLIKGICTTADPLTFQPSINFNGNVIINSIVQKSLHPVWDDLSIFDIIQRALSMIGVNLQSPSISQYAEQIKREGQ